MGAGLAGALLDCTLFNDAGVPLNDGGLRFQTSGRATAIGLCRRSRASRPPASRPLHGVRPGHALNVELLKELLSNEENYAVVDVSVEK